jgi:Domain of unknown function (DUF4340)
LSEVIVDRGTEHVRVERRADASYGVLEPVKVAADTEVATGLFLQFSALEAERMVDEKAANVAQYGLEPARVVITAVRKKGPPVKILLGEMSPTGMSTYAKVEGDAKVFTFSQMVASGFEKTFAELRDKRLIPFDRATVSHIRITGEGTADIAPDQSSWKVGGYRADGSAVDQLLSGLDQARMNPQATAAAMADAAKAWGGAAVVGSVRVTDAAGEHTLEVRRAKALDAKGAAAVYVRSSAMEGTHMGTAELADAVGKAAADYRNARVFDFGFDDPGKVEVKGGGLQRTLTQADGKWSEAGKALDSVGAQSLVDKLRELKASGFVTKAGGGTELELTVVSSSGQRNEHVVITKDGAKFAAKRDGELEYYALDAQAVGDLRQAAQDVREAVKSDGQKSKK